MRRFGVWNASLLAGGAYVLVVFVVALVLPIVNEVPEQFPAVVLWQFRIAALGSQLIMWTTLGLAFGALAERLLARRGDHLICAYTAKHVVIFWNSYKGAPAP